MKRQTIIISACLLALGFNSFAQTPPTSHTIAKNEEIKQHLNFANRQDFDDAQRGFIATVEGDAIYDKNGNISYTLAGWDFLKQETPHSANPSLWRQSQLNRIHGLFEVIPGKIYQIRGFDIANMTFVRTDNGWIIIDVTTADAPAKAGYDLIKKHVGDLPIRAVIFTHPHADHYGGINAIIEGAPNKDFPIIAPEGFMEAAQSENVMAGVAMTRRATYMYGMQLRPDSTGFIGTGLGQTIATGPKGIATPTDLISHTGEKRTIDGLDMEFIYVPDGEAPVEIMIYFPAYKAFCNAEEMTCTMHNLLTLRGAKVRDGLGWSKAIDEAITRYGNEVEVCFASHNWPKWGNKRVVEYWEKQRDMYRYLHDQTLHLANRGLTPNEIAEEIQFPASIDTVFNCRGYYGTISHNTKSQYQMYFGWYDGNPANLNPLPPAELGKKYVEAIGGADKVLAVARQGYEQGDYRWVATLLNHLVFADPSNQEARRLLANTYTQLGYQAESGPWRNFYLTGAKELTDPRVAYTSRLINLGVISKMELDMLFDYFAIQISGPKAAGKEATINLTFTDTGDRTVLILKNGVLTHRLDRQGTDADLSMSLTKMDFIRLFLGDTTLDTLQKDGKLQLTGDTAAFEAISSSLEPADPDFRIVEP